LEDADFIVERAEYTEPTKTKENIFKKWRFPLKLIQKKCDAKAARL
jgi:hypothetical protein